MTATFINEARYLAGLVAGDAALGLLYLRMTTRAR
jgi:hypothetical protein